MNTVHNTFDPGESIKRTSYRKIWVPASKEVQEITSDATNTFDNSKSSAGNSYFRYWNDKCDNISQNLSDPIELDRLIGPLPKTKSCWFELRTNNLQNPTDTTFGVLKNIKKDICEVFHNSNEIRNKQSSNTNKFKTIKIRIFPTKEQTEELLQESLRHRWFYNAYLNTFDWTNFKQELNDAKTKGSYVSETKYSHYTHTATLKNFEYIEELEYTPSGREIIFCSLRNKDKSNDQFVREEIDKKVKQLFNKYKQDIKDFKSSDPKPSKKETDEYSAELKKELEENKKTIRIGRPKNKDDYPQAECLGKINKRLIVGACASFTQNLNSIASNYVRDNIQKFNMNFKTQKDKHEFICYPNNAFPKLYKKLEGNYYYRNNNRKRVKISASKLLEKWKSKGFRVIQDKQTKAWYMCIAVDLKWFPANDDRHNKQLKPSTNRAIGLDLGMRKFGTGFDTSGNCLFLGDQAWRKISPLLYRINKLEEKLQKIRKNIAFDEENEQKSLKYKVKLWTRVKNLIKDIHWKTINYLVKNYKYIFLGNIMVSSMVKNQTSKLPKLCKRIILQYSFHEFKLRLEHKCKMFGCKLIYVNEALTSKTCSSCGSENNVGCSEVYNCNQCGSVCDRDLNAAKNMLIKGLSVL